MGKFAIEATGLIKHFGETHAVDGVDLSVPGPCTGCSVRTAPARPRSSGCSPRCCAPTPGRRGSSATTSCARPARCGVGSASRVSSRPSTRISPVWRTSCCSAACSASRAPAAASAAATRSVRSRDAGGPTGEEVFGRHAPAHRHRRQHRRDARPDLSRRADHRARPAQPQPGLGHRACVGRRRHHGAAHDAVPRRGGPARRPHRGDRRGQGDRRGHQQRAQGIGRRGAIHVRLGDPLRPEAQEVLARVLGGRSSCRADPAARLAARSPTPPALARSLAELRIAASMSPTSRSASPAWTRCSSH